MSKKKLEEDIKAALKEQKKEQAKNLAKQAISKHPDDAFGYALLAEALIMDRPIPFIKAEYCLAKASQIEPKNTDYLARFATLKDQQKQFDKSQLLWGKIVGLDPTHLQASMKRGGYLMRNNKNYRYAIEFFDKVIEHHPEFPRSYFMKAVSNLELKEYEAALSDYEKFVELKGGEEDERDLRVKKRIMDGLNPPEETVEQGATEEPTIES
jgi:tetratricopeptide (TPR) repeat protein